MTEGACENTDRELWRERFDDFYADSIHVTKDGGIGINVSGHVIVMPLQKWHALAKIQHCIGNDQTCPCQDGDACHYKDSGKTKAWPIPPQT